MKKVKKNNVTNSFDTRNTVKVVFDKEMCEILEKEYDKKFIAYKNEEYGIGVTVSQDMDFGVYGNDFASKALISIYWDQHKGDIERALITANSMEKLCEATMMIIGKCVVDIRKNANAA